jgi:predicted outer membrane repeat protein
MGAVFFLFFRSAGKKIVDADPLLVTTAFDVVDANDGVNSLREALNYARFRGEQTIAFRIPGSDAVNLDEPSLITSSMRFASSNEATGKPMNVVLNRLSISGRNVTTPEGVEGGGAALYANGGNFIVKGGSYRENSDGGFGGTGGAIRLINGSLTIEDAAFTQNHAYSRGGAVSVENASLTIRGGRFEDNGAVGFGGAVSVQRGKARITDTKFTNNMTLANILYLWMGGAILLDESELVYEVTKGTTVTNAGNRSGAGGFIAMRGNSSAEFRVDGVLNIGDGRDDTFDSFCSWDEPGNAKGDRVIRKTGGGIMTINGSVANYDDNWILEDGVLAFAYPGGGDFDGEIASPGGQPRLESPYAFKSLVLRLGSRTDGPAFVNGLSRLTGGTVRVDLKNAAEGTYLLAEGAEDFNGSIMLRDTDGESAVSAGEAVNAGGFHCTLDLNGGALRLSLRK